MISARPVTAAIGNPPVSDFAIVMRSGSSPRRSHANRAPVREKPVCTSSAITKDVVLATDLRENWEKFSGRSDRIRPSPMIGSTMTAATVSVQPRV